MSVNKSLKLQLVTTTDEQIKTLLKLEELFHSKCLTLDLVNELISIYVNVIQCFDQRLLPFRTYFLSKIQYVVTRKQVLNLLETNQDGDKARQTIRFKERFMDQQLEKIYQQTARQNKFKEHTHKNELGAIKERNMKVQLQMKIMRQLQQGVKNIAQQANIMDKKAQKHDQEISSIFKKQQTSLQQRLNARRKRKPRKKSADNIKKNSNEDEDPQPVLNKQELLAAQRDVAQAVVRITLRMTQKSLGLGMLTTKQPQKGRMKMVRVQQDSDQQKNDQVFSPKAMKKKQNNILEAEGRKQSSNRGTNHDQRDKGRVTNRRRNSSQQDQ